MITALNFLIRITISTGERLLAYFRPDCALIVDLYCAFVAVRNESAWPDQAHRNIIARHLGSAADAIERFMPRYFTRKTDFSSTTMIRQRFKETAIPLRQRLVWLATPGPLTRTDLEAELRKALVAASLGQLDQLGGMDESTQMAQAERRSWSGMLTDVCRGLAWALTPLGLVQLGSALQLPLLSDPGQQMAAQRAAYIWLLIAILRALSPGGFKETIEATGSLLGRGKSSQKE
jgi:hypothetical protein